MRTRRASRSLADLLNEVLSLNAQEYPPATATASPSAFLNEVLSLNAQE